MALLVSSHLWEPNLIHLFRYGAATSQCSKLSQDDTQYLLALALAYIAFWDITSAAELWEMQIPQGEEELPLRWTNSAKLLPIFRDATMQHGVSEEPLLKRKLDRIVKSVLNLSGYFAKATVHAIRRYVGKTIDVKSNDLRTSRSPDFASLAKPILQTRQLSMGDWPSLTSLSVDHVDYFQSFAKYREKGHLSSLPAEKEAPIIQDPQLTDMESHISRLGSGLGTSSEIKDALSKPASRRKLCSCTNYGWVRERRNRKVMTRGKELPEDDEETEHVKIVSRITP
ncbi:MAG: hypothetical protein M1837_002522 [Sclerophora amabilis]|nr:MAG: hypothetical protein M1837_002522 [Sclerophora amabilis]